MKKSILTLVLMFPFFASAANSININKIAGNIILEVKSRNIVVSCSETVQSSFGNLEMIDKDYNFELKDVTISGSAINFTYKSLGLVAVKNVIVPVAPGCTITY